MPAAVAEELPESGLREVVRIAWPLVINNAVWTLQVFIDRAMLARHDGSELAATLNSVMVFWTGLNLFFFTTLYVGTFVAQYGGAGRPHRIGPVIGQAWYTALIGGCFFIAVSPFAEAIFARLSSTPEVAAHEATYFRCLCFSAMPTLMMAATNSFFIGRGDTRTVLGITTVGLIVNAVFDALFIFGNAGFPEMGIAGAGWATVAGQCVGAACSMGLFLRARHRAEFRTGEFWRFDPALFRRLLYYGVPNGLFVAIETGAFTGLTLFISSLGVKETAATTMAFTLNLVAFLPALGVGQTIEILVGKYQGEGRPDVSAQRTYVGFALAWTIMAVMAVAYFTMPKPLLAPFRGVAAMEAGGATGGLDLTAGPEADEVLALATVLLRFVAFYSLFDAANSVFSFALRGAGDTRFVMYVVSFLPWIGMVLPCAIAWKAGYGLYTYWAIASLYIATLAFVFFARFRHGAWRSMKVIEAVDEAN